MIDKTGNRIKGETKETEFWSPKAEALCYLRCLLLKECFGNLPKRTRDPRVLPQMLLRCQGGDDVFEARFSAQRIPSGEQFQFAIGEIAG